MATPEFCERSPAPSYLDQVLLLEEIQRAYQPTWLETGLVDKAAARAIRSYNLLDLLEEPGCHISMERSVRLEGKGGVAFINLVLRFPPRETERVAARCITIATEYAGIVFPLDEFTHEDIVPLMQYFEALEELKTTNILPDLDDSLNRISEPPVLQLDQ